MQATVFPYKQALQAQNGHGILGKTGQFTCYPEVILQKFTIHQQWPEVNFSCYGMQTSQYIEFAKFAIALMEFEQPLVSTKPNKWCN